MEDVQTYLAPPIGTVEFTKGGSLDRGADGRYCVMEYISMITGDSFTDAPMCTAFQVTAAAVAVNDRMTSTRVRTELLLPLVPRLLASRPGYSDASYDVDRETRELVDSLFNQYDAAYPRGFGPFEGQNERLRDVLVQVLDFYEQRMGDIGEPLRRIEVVPQPIPEEAPVKEPSPEPAPAQEPVPA